MEYFVDKRSVVREIWGKSDTILVIFAGAAAEFALNKAVDWLYFTGRLPADPMGRLFSTVSYARKIVFSDRESAYRAIDSITAIHAGVETSRGATIPDWAYRDVLFMLIDYSIRSFELLERKLSKAEKQEVFDVFHRLGSRLGISGLPETHGTWELMRQEHLDQDLKYSGLTKDLYRQYRKQLAPLRYRVLLESQSLIVPNKVRVLLGLRKFSILRPFVGWYKLSRIFKLDRILQAMILPDSHRNEFKAFESVRS